MPVSKLTYQRLAWEYANKQSRYDLVAIHPGRQIHWIDSGVDQGWAKLRQFPSQKGSSLIVVRAEVGLRHLPDSNISHCVCLVCVQAWCSVRRCLALRTR